MKRVTGLLVALTAVISFAFVVPKTINTKQINIVIDAGHGGKDHGVSTDLYTEKQITDLITQKIKAKNENKNIIIHLTRTADEFVSLSERTKMINKLQPDLVLSLHVNGNKNISTSGVEFYVSNENKAYQKSVDLAQKLSDKFTRDTSLKNRGIKEASFMILKKSEVAAITVELGYLTNPSDRQYLTDDNEQNRIASTILELISEME